MKEEHMTDPKPSHVPSGYEIGTDEQGLTARERDIRDRILKGETASQIGAALTLTRQRVSQIQKSLVTKGVLEKKDGRYVAAGKKRR